MSFSLKRIKAPSKGLLSMHPFVDVLEGRNLFTGSAHDGILDVQQVVDARSSEVRAMPWSANTIADETDAIVVDSPATALVRQTTPHQFELKPETSGTAFSESSIDDTPWALFGNALHDRRGTFEPQPLPTEEQIAAARNADTGDVVFSTARSMTGAMAPFLTMSITQQNHPFAG